jgi:membrane associated rhomboid family serine protease
MNVVIFLSYYSLFSDPQALSRFFYTWGVVPAQITEGHRYAPLLTSMFLHGGILHIAGNMLFLWIFGDNLEDALGPGRYLLFYLTCGVAAALLQVPVAPHSTVPVVGASGAIAGVMGGYLLLFPKARVDILLIIIIIIRIITVPAWLLLGIWFGIQLVSGVGDIGAAGGVAHWEHIGGFIAGLLLCLPVWFGRGGVASWAETRGRPPHPEATTRFTRSNVPRVPRRTRRPGPWG